ncbi:MAG: lytic transglycosylase domain-containing protein [Spirochaetota bacterium]
MSRIAAIIAVTALLGCSSAGALLTGPLRSDSYTFEWSSGGMGGVAPVSYPNVANLLEGENPALALYREDVTHDHVVAFFTELAGSEEIALPILYHADRHDLPITLVFSLVWVESRYDPSAQNRNPTSIDRGLFQLNSRSFRQLTTEDFFAPDINARYGASHLRYCLDLASDEPTALAIYNAGYSRVRAGIIPATTQIYIRRILDYKAGLDERFRRYIATEFPVTT